MAKLYDSARDARFRVANLTEYFRQTGNVAAAWTAWHVARTYGVPVPDTIAAEVDRFAAAIAARVDSKNAGQGNARLGTRMVGLLWAGEEGDRRGKTDPAWALAEWERDSAAAADVLRRRDGGATEASAVASVADARGMSASAVRAAVRRFRAADTEVSGKGAI